MAHIVKTMPKLLVSKLCTASMHKKRRKYAKNGENVLLSGEVK